MSSFCFLFREKKFSKTCPTCLKFWALRKDRRFFKEMCDIKRICLFYYMCTKKRMRWVWPSDTQNHPFPDFSSGCKQVCGLELFDIQPKKSLLIERVN